MKLRTHAFVVDCRRRQPDLGSEHNIKQPVECYTKCTTASYFGLKVCSNIVYHRNTTKGYGLCVCYSKNVRNVAACKAKSL